MHRGRTENRTENRTSEHDAPYSEGRFLVRFSRETAREAKIRAAFSNFTDHVAIKFLIEKKGILLLYRVREVPTLRIET